MTAKQRVYLYVSNAQPGKRILLLFYEHPAYLLLKKSTAVAGNFFAILRAYPNHFKLASKDRDAYWLAIDEAIEAATRSSDLHEFRAPTSAIVSECVLNAADRIEARITRVEGEEGSTTGGAC